MAAVIATAKGYHEKIRNVGDQFEWPDDKPLPSWVRRKDGRPHPTKRVRATGEAAPIAPTTAADKPKPEAKGGKGGKSEKPKPEAKAAEPDKPGEGAQ